MHSLYFLPIIMMGIPFVAVGNTSLCNHYVIIIDLSDPVVSFCFGYINPLIMLLRGLSKLPVYMTIYWYYYYFTDENSLVSVVLDSRIEGSLIFSSFYCTGLENRLIDCAIHDTYPTLNKGCKKDKKFYYTSVNCTYGKSILVNCTYGKSTSVNCT